MSLCMNKSVNATNHTFCIGSNTNLFRVETNKLIVGAPPWVLPLCSDVHFICAIPLEVLKCVGEIT